MGNICGKASSSDVSSAGRRLDSAPATKAATSTHGGAINLKPHTPSTIPLKTQKKAPKITGPGRTLGSPVSDNEGGVTGAREAAAVAAEVCLAAYHSTVNILTQQIHLQARELAAKAAVKKGPLSTKLEAQKRQTSKQQIPANRKNQGPSVDEALSWN